MKNARIVSLFLAAVISCSSISCKVISNPYVLSIIVSFGRKLKDTIIFKAAEKTLDKIFGLIDSASDKVSDFRDQVQPQANKLLGQIPGDDSMYFLVQGERGGRQDTTTISIPTSLIFFRRSSLDTDDWELTAESRTLIHDRLEVAAAQISLQNFGYTVEVDGLFGKQTKSAVIKFQETHRIFKTGWLDEGTKKLLFTR